MTLLLALALSAIALAAPSSNAPIPPSPVVVVSNYDGDTVTLATGDKVRLLLANTPEMKPEEDFAVQARDLTHRLVANKEVTLHVGPQPRDGYGRILAGIEVEGQDLAMALLQEGLAHVYIVPPESVDTAPYLAAQEAARAAKKGIWVTAEYQRPLHITSFHANGQGDDKLDANVEYFRICNIGTAPLSLQGYRVEATNRTTWPLPAVTVPVGHTVKVHSGIGGQQTDPSRQLELYLGSPKPIWNDSEDSVVIYDAEGHVVSQRSHKTKQAEEAEAPPR